MKSDIVVLLVFCTCKFVYFIIHNINNLYHIHIMFISSASFNPSIHSALLFLNFFFYFWGICMLHINRNLSSSRVFDCLSTILVPKCMIVSGGNDKWKCKSHSLNWFPLFINTYSFIVYNFVSRWIFTVQINKYVMFGKYFYF